jgi:hypothetical protein
VPDEDKYAPALQAMAQQVGVNVNMPLAISWTTSIIGRWLRLVTSLGRDNEIHGFGQFILSPLTKSFFAAPETFDDHQFQLELKNLPEFGRDGAEICDFYKRKFDPVTADYIDRAVSWCFTSTLPNIDSAKEQYLKTLETLKSQLSETHQSPREVSAWQIAQDAAEQVAQLDVVCQFSGNFWQQFLANVYRTASQESIRDTGEPLSGLQIIGLTEARYIPFNAVFIVGCVEGSFPHGLPRDSLIDNKMRRVMGLPGWGELEALEDTTFHLLTSRLPHVELTYPHSDADKPLTRSRWIEILATRMKPRQLDSSDKSTSILNMEWEATTTNLPLANTNNNEGLVTDVKELLASTSASRLRHLLWCPYRYLMQARKVETVELPEDRINLQTGNWLHKVLETFFKHDDLKGLAERLQWRSKPASAAEFASWAHDRLDGISQLVVPKSLSRSAQFQHMTGRGWASIAQFWQSLCVQGWSPDLVRTEIELGKKDPPLLFELAGQAIKIHGTVDAIHGGAEHGPILMDYKTSTTPANRDIAEGLEPQLPLYAKALSMAAAPAEIGSKVIDLTDTAVGYFNLSDGKASFVALGDAAKENMQTGGLLSKRSKPLNLPDTIKAVEKRWGERLTKINSTNSFAADPSDCAMCSYAGVCRKDDPRFRDQISQQKVARPDRTEESSGDEQESRDEVSAE